MKALMGDRIRGSSSGLKVKVFQNDKEKPRTINAGFLYFFFLVSITTVRNADICRYLLGYRPVNS